MDSMLGGALSFLLLAIYVYVKFVRSPSTRWKDDMKYEAPQSYRTQDYFVHPHHQPAVMRRRPTHQPPPLLTDTVMDMPLSPYAASPPPMHQYPPQGPPMPHEISRDYPMMMPQLTQSPGLYHNYPLPSPPPVPFIMHGETNLNQLPSPRQENIQSRERRSSSTFSIGTELYPRGPAQLQLEVAQRARIPLFLKAPMHARTTCSSVDSTVSTAPVQRMEEESPPVVVEKERKVPKSNNNLHIDFATIKLGKMIGKGAFGTVHQGSWRGTLVAVKILVSQNMNQDLLEEFEAEVQIMSVLRHPNICLLMGACLEPPTRCLVVELVPKGSLWDVLRQHIDVTYDMQLSFARDTSQGMNYLHSFTPPILHRDLKSPNLLVDNAFGIKISDFGLARVKAHIQTMTGNCGTMQWMAPEVLAAQKYTEKADVFSFGIVLWETITRACPYEGLSQIQAALGVLNNNLRPTIPVHCPVLLKRVMKSCWATVPSQRPSFGEILQQLQEPIG